MRDPVGPGTPAWNAFDHAIEAWQAYKHRGLGSRSKEAKRFWNCRQHMIDYLKAHNCTAEEIGHWTAQLNIQREEPFE